MTHLLRSPTVHLYKQTMSTSSSFSLTLPLVPFEVSVHKGVAFFLKISRTFFAFFRTNHIGHALTFLVSGWHLNFIVVKANDWLSCALVVDSQSLALTTVRFQPPHLHDILVQLSPPSTPRLRVTICTRLCGLSGDSQLFGLVHRWLNLTSYRLLRLRILQNMSTSAVAGFGAMTRARASWSNLITEFLHKGSICAGCRGNTELCPHRSTLARRVHLNRYRIDCSQREVAQDRSRVSRPSPTKASPSA